MALTYDGKLYAWGENSDGEAGVGTSSDITVPTLCTGITQGTVAKLLRDSELTDGSHGQVSAIKTIDGNIHMAGKGDNYCIPGKTSDQTSFTDVTSYFGDQSLTANTVTMTSFTDRSGAALTETGNVWTWGTHDSTYKALGQAGASSSSTPKQINFSSATDNITQITSGYRYNLALDSSGDVWFWGKNNINSDSWPSSITDEPQKVVDGKNIIGLASGYGTMYAWDATGKMWNAGNNWEGQVGDGTTTASSTGKTLTEVTYFSSNNITINKVYGGGYFTFADTSDGYYCWGNGGHGVFGNGSTGSLTSGPVKWTNVSNIKKFVACTQSTAAITEDGKYYAWGRDGSGERGDSDSSSDISYPKHIDALPNILAPSFEFDGYDKVFVNPAVGLSTNIGLNKKIDSVSGYFGQYTHGSTTNSEITNDMNFTTTILTNGYPTDFSVLGQNIVRQDQTLEIGQWHSNNQSDPWFRINLEKDSYVDNCVLHRTSLTSTRYQNVRFQLLDSSETQIKEVNVGDFGSTVTFKTAFCHASGVRYVKVVTGSSSYTHYDEIRINGYVLADSIVKYTKGTTTYDAGKASIVTVPDPGTYDAQLTQGGTFSLKSETVPATKASGLYTWAFHHGNFDNAYGDGDILTARDNGRFYADTPAYTGDIGTITPVNPTESSNVSFKLNQYTQGSSSESNATGIMLTEIDVFDDTNTAMTYGTDYRADLYRAAFADNGQDGGSGKLSDETTPYNDDGGRLSDDTLHGSGGYIGWVNGTYDASATSLNRKYPYSVDDELIRLVPLTGKAIGKVQFAYKGTGTTPGWKVYKGTTLIETTNYAGTDINSQGNQTTHQIVDVKSKTTYTFTPASSLTSNVLMVAGGGGGGRVQFAGGGGAGGLVYTAGTTLSGAKTIVVGNGGLIGGDSGNDTTFTNLTTAVKGGYGGDGSGGIEAQDGGSGGGQAWATSTTSSGTAGQGYGGGGKGSATADECGGGGGGAGEAGHDGWIVGSAQGDGRGGNGGKGKFFGTGSSFTNFGDEYGEDGWFAGGGGGGTIRNSWSGLGGKGGGGRGYGVLEYKQNTEMEGLKGFHHTGGGGGGGGWSGKDGGGGGSGIVLIQTNVPTPRVNTNVGVPKDYYIHGIIEDSQTHVAYKRGAGSSGSSSGFYDNIKKPDGSLGRVYRGTGGGGISINGADSLISSIEAVFYPIEKERYDNILEIGHNWQHDIELEMASDGTAKLYRNNGGTHLASGTVKCFTVGKWHHIVLTLDTNRNAVAYVNGYPVVSTTYSSAILPGSRAENQIFRLGVSGTTARKFMFYYFKTYNSVLNQNQILKLASSVGLGPKLEYDGLNTLKILNTEPGSTVKLFTSNVADTSNVFIVADPAADEYTIPESGKYYAEIKGTDTFTVTKTLDVSGTFPLYAYPPRDGTHSSITTTQTVNQWDTWTISGASNGNGQYQARSNHAGPSATRTSYSAFKNDITPGAGEHNMGAITGTRHLDLQLPSAKTIRKYIIWLTDSAFYTGNATTTYTQYDPVGTMAYNGNERGVRRIKSWTIQGSNNDSDWTTIHTVTNKPPSNYGDLHTISSPGSYQYYRIAVTEHMGSSQVTMIGELIYYGD
jgi:alpha-tubulin suppressor-like RCC1 family protein